MNDATVPFMHYGTQRMVKQNTESVVCAVLHTKIGEINHRKCPLCHVTHLEW